MNSKHWLYEGEAARSIWRRTITVPFIISSFLLDGFSVHNRFVIVMVIKST
jgi:hypothetical protein